MQIKDEIRQEIKEKRRLIDNKSDRDSAVCANVINSHIFKNADTILCYSALRYEILTDEIIKCALVLDKTVSLPYCTDKNGNMQFYIISFSYVSWINPMGKECRTLVWHSFFVEK